MVEAMRPSADAVLERFAKSLCCIVEAEPLPRLDIIPRRPALLDMGPGGAHDKTLSRKQFLDDYDAGTASEQVDPGDHARERPILDCGATRYCAGSQRARHRQVVGIPAHLACHLACWTAPHSDAPVP